MLAAAVTAIAYHLPSRTLTNELLGAEFPDWGVEKIFAKTGICTRHVAAPGECSSDLAFAAAQKLFDTNCCRRGEIDFIIFCTQTPDHILPTTACLLQHRLGLPTHAGALDFNLGCSGYIFGLSLCKGLIETGQARKILFLTGETYTKLIDATDKSVRTLFGDGGTATLVEAVEASAALLGPFVFGTDGGGGPNLICRQNGFRPIPSAAGATLRMDGPEIFNFTIKAVPDAIDRLLALAGIKIEEVDWFVFHQANAYMLEHLRKKIGIPAEKFVLALADSGNTVSCTIPIALHEARREGRILPGARVLLVGFGVGYSWGATLMRYR